MNQQRRLAAALSIALGFALTTPGQSDTPVQRPTPSEYRELQRKYAEANKAMHEAEAFIHEGAGQYAEQTKDRLRTVAKESLTMIIELWKCRRNPEAEVCQKVLGPPSAVDLAKLFKEQVIDYLNPTVLSLRGSDERLAEAHLKLVNAEKRRIELKVQEDRYVEQQRNARRTQRQVEEPTTGPTLPPPPPPRPTEKDYSALDEYIMTECFNDQGDRCFDTMPDRFRPFVDSHPAATAAHEARYRSPDTRIEPGPDHKACYDEYSACEQRCRGSWMPLGPDHDQYSICQKHCEIRRKKCLGEDSHYDEAWVEMAEARLRCKRTGEICRGGCKSPDLAEQLNCQADCTEAQNQCSELATAIFEGKRVNLR